MPKRLQPVAHDDRLSLVEHLDELRSRLIVSAVVVGAALALCFWQNHLILGVVNAPLAGKEAALFGPGAKPLTFGVAEQFTTTFTLSAYAALLLSMPILLYQAYAFILPAFSPSERRVALPMLLMVPFLFIGGVCFGYFVVLSPALDFLLSFNADEFTTSVRARDYYSFVTLSLLALGLLFQVPVGILVLTRLGVVTPQQLRKNRRYAILGCAVLAALLPTIDPLTLVFEMVPLIILYEVSIVLAQILGGPAAKVEPASAESS